MYVSFFFFFLIGLFGTTLAQSLNFGVCPVTSPMCLSPCTDQKVSFFFVIFPENPRHFSGLTLQAACLSNLSIPAHLYVILFIYFCHPFICSNLRSNILLPKFVVSIMYQCNLLYGSFYYPCPFSEHFILLPMHIICLNMSILRYLNFFCGIFLLLLSGFVATLGPNSCIVSLHII